MWWKFLSCSEFHTSSAGLHLLRELFLCVLAVGAAVCRRSRGPGAHYTAGNSSVLSLRRVSSLLSVHVEDRRSLQNHERETQCSRELSYTKSLKLKRNKWLVALNVFVLIWSCSIKSTFETVDSCVVIVRACFNVRKCLVTHGFNLITLTLGC